MRFPIAVTGSRQKLLLAILGVAACLHAPFANSQQQETPQANSVVELGQRANFAHGSYILGPGDGLEINWSTYQNKDDSPSAQTALFISPTTCVGALP